MFIATLCAVLYIFMHINPFIFLFVRAMIRTCKIVDVCVGACACRDWVNITYFYTVKKTVNAAVTSLNEFMAVHGISAHGIFYSKDIAF